ncbi:Ig-like domain-containing protein [Nocardioides sp. L-11A]|uniref:Ig-like domain-containing protein n=1 Tax=Nocardioides sp. L-11A TaxID=3043848 RepID=UPI002499E14C|nr:Ig-like domain-containing protein [Nocardioides sp. L-11A]
MAIVSLRGPRSFVRRHRTSLASWTALAAVGGGLLVYAIGSDGQTVHRADLNDGGVWVTNQDLQAIGRQNMPIEQLDAYVDAGQSAQPDILQDGSAVVSVDGSVLTPVSATRGAAVPDGAVNAAGPASLGGGSLAAVDPEKGEVWATRLDPGADVTSLAELNAEADPLAEVGPEAVVVATRTGSVVAASAATGKVLELAPTAAGFTKPAALDVPDPRDGIVAATAVGSTPVLLDGAGRLLVPGVKAVEIADPSAVKGGQVLLQQPGPAADEVFVGTDTGLAAVGLDDGDVRRIDAGSGQPVAPVRINGCVFGVWASGTSAQAAMACDGADPVGPNPFEISPAAELRFRVNRNQAVLNDVRTGAVWSMNNAQPTQIADWQAIKPQDPKDSQDDEKKTDSEQVRQAPQAKTDNLGARAGGTTVLHVLDNDLVSGGGVLTITDVAPPADKTVAVQVSPDRQSLLLTVPPAVTSPLTFGYTISDGTGGKDSTADGTVNIATRAVDDPGTAQPTLRKGAEPPTYPMAARGSVEFSVLPDWRDEQYGDPVSLDGIEKVPGVESSVTAEGLIRIQAAGASGAVRVPYRVSTGGEPGQGVVVLDVLPKGSNKAVPAQALPDVASGEVGGPIAVQPLDNDIPGADPSDAQARLALAGRVAPTRGLDVATDLESGRVTVQAQRPGTYQLTYAAGFGAAARATGKITVVVDPASDKGDLPIASPDTTIVHGTAPIVVDVLANDYDPKGRMLAVQQAEPVDPDSGLEVAVVDGRWLRINGPLGMPAGQRVEYTVSNGAGSAKSTVAVTQKEPLPPEQNIPIPTDDDVTVRVGDSAVVPVLDNDSTPGGDPVGLKTLAAEGLPMGELTVNPPLGRAYVSGRNVRYVAPAADEIGGPTTVEVTYIVQNEADLSIPHAAGTLRVKVTPEPTDQNPNQPPTPRAVEGRVVQGDEVALRPPLVGNDPDGDSITIVGLDRPPALGRLLSFGADSLVYEAFPGSQGTDEFTFRVQDRYGAVAVGSARVAVTPAGAPQAPVAVNDVVVAAPGRDLEIDVLANDLRMPGTGLELLPLQGAPDGVAVDERTGLVEAVAPENTKEALIVPYRVSTGFDESGAELSIRSEKGYNNPPVVEDAYARPDGDSAEVVVDVLATAYDIDGQGRPVRLESVGDATATFDDAGKVTIPVTAAPQVIPFRVEDGEGATATASIYVPARPTDTPYLKAGAAITLEPGETKDVPIEDLVVDPEGDAVHLTLADRIVGAPAEKLQASAPDSDQTLRVTAAKDASGPGAVTFEVADGKGLATAHLAVLAVPVTIGSGDPVLNCPQEPISVLEGGISRSIDIATVCHVWAPDPAAAADIDYTVAWAEGQQPQDVDAASDGGRVSLTAGVNARRGDTGVLEIGAAGADVRDSAGRKPTLLVRVVPAGPPRLRPMTAEGEAGQAVTIDVATYAKSPFGSDAQWALVGDVEKVSAPAAVDVSVSGTTVSMTPSAFGVYTFRVTLADDGAAKGSTRPRASGLIKLSVVSAPDQPTGLRTDGRVYDEQVKLLWSPPSANGGAITGYTVNYAGGPTTCPSNACVISGLQNGKDYSFTVIAHNQYGDSPESAATSGTPDTVPTAVGGLAVTRQLDRKVELTWTAPPGDGSDFSRIEKYQVSWPGGGIQDVAAGARSYTATLPTNGETVEFSVWAVNALDAGPKASVPGMGAGKPDVPEMNSPQTSDTAGRANKAVTVSWGAVGANGPTPVEYEVTRTGGGGSKVVCAWRAATSCADTLGNDGTVYSYAVRARNGEAVAPREPSPDLHISANSQAVSVEAAAVPDTITGLKVVATGVNNQAQATFDVGASHGKTNKIECQPGCGTIASTTVGTGGQANVTFKVNVGPNGSNGTIRVRTCNGAADSALACSPWVSDGTTPFGPLANPSISASGSGECFSWSVSGNANGKSVHVTVTGGGNTLASYDTAGSINRSGSTCPGYSKSWTFKVTMDDSGSSAEQPQDRGSKSATDSASTPAPPPTVSVRKGTPCSGSGCGGAVIPCASTCWNVVTTGTNFQGTVRCHITGGGPSWNQGNGDTTSAGNWVGPNYTFKVYCDNGASTGNVTW